MVAANIGPATMNTMTIPGKSASNDPRVHPQPKTSVAPDTAVSTSHCTRCAGDGTQSASTPNAANIVAATMANVPADSDAGAVGAHRPDERVGDRRERRGDQRRVDRDLAAVLRREVALVLLASGAEHGDQEEQEDDVERSRFRIVPPQVDDEQGGRRQRDQRHAGRRSTGTSATIRPGGSA